MNNSYIYGIYYIIFKKKLTSYFLVNFFAYFTQCLFEVII